MRMSERLVPNRHIRTLTLCQMMNRYSHLSLSHLIQRPTDYNHFCFQVTTGHVQLTLQHYHHFAVACFVNIIVNWNLYSFIQRCVFEYGQLTHLKRVFYIGISSFSSDWFFFYVLCLKNKTINFCFFEGFHPWLFVSDTLWCIMSDTTEWKNTQVKNPLKIIVM